MKSNWIYCWLILVGCLLVSPSYSPAQSSQRSFAFVDIPTFTHLAALGGSNNTAGQYPLMFLSNPALLDSGQINEVSFHYLNFPGGLNFGTVGYSFKRNRGSSNEVFGVAVQYFNYGEFDGFDATGFPMGNFQANEFNFTMAYGRSQGIFRYGSNIKVLGSVLESYQAYAIVMDLGISWRHPEQDMQFGLTANNVGFVLSGYLEGQALTLPTDIRLGGSYKPEYMPLRFHLTARNLLEEDGFYSAYPLTGKRDQNFGEKIFGKLVIGAEILAHENFNLQIGYNHLVRRELTIEQKGGAGISGGFVFRVRQFQVSYARMFYRIAGSSNLFGITTNIKEWRRF